MASELVFAVLIKALDEATAPIRQVQGQLSKLGNEIKGLNAAQKAMLGAQIGGVGAAIALPLKASIEAYSELQAAQNHLLTALPAGQLGFKELAQATRMAADASLKFNVSQQDVLENVFLGISAGLTFHQAMANAFSSVATAKGTQGDIADTGRLTAQVVKLFGDAKLTGAAATAQIQHFNDVIAYGVREKAFRNIGELNVALSESVGSAKAARVPFNDLFAVLAGFQQAGLVGSQAGEAFTETVQRLGQTKEFGKLGVQVATFKNGAVDVLGTIIKIKEALAQKLMTPEELERVTKALGARGSRLLAVNIADLKKAQQEFSSSAVSGAALEGARITMAGLAEQTGAARQSLTQLEETIGAQLAPELTTLAGDLTRVLGRLTSFAEAHPMLVKALAVFAAVAAAVAIVTGGFLVLAGAVQFAAVSFATLGIIAGITAAIAAVGAIIITFWPQIKSFFTTLIPEFFNAGLNLMKSLGRGILAGVEYPIHAAEGLARHIEGYFVGHSPPPFGPLHNLNRVAIAETIAQRIRPAPILAAITRTAAAVAVAAPLMAAPAAAGAAPGITRLSGGAPIVHYAPVINGSGLGEAELLRVLETHAYELRRILNREDERHERTELS